MSSDAKSAMNKCSISVERGWGIGEESDKCICCVPLHMGIYLIAFCIMLGGLNAVFTLFKLGDQKDLMSVVGLILGLAPIIFAAFLVFMFCFRSKKRELMVQAVQCVILSSILLAIATAVCDLALPWGAIIG